MVRRLSINMPLLDALQVLTYSRYFKDIMGNKHEILPSTVKLTEECSAAIANEAPEKKKGPRMSYHPVFHWISYVRKSTL